jgi:hypothetical protein
MSPSKKIQELKMLTINETNKNGFHSNDFILQEQQMIKKRIRFLQQSLIKISFASEKNRPELYAKILETLHSAQLLLIKNKEIQLKESSF